MNSSIINILEILRVAKTLNSVGFSSGYHFDETCADEFFDELIADMSVMEPIFSGIIIIETSSEDEALTIVDGLQRITTLNLLLNALCEVAKNTSKRNEDSRNKIFTRYLVDENRVKLELSGAEYDIYRKIVFSESLTEDEIKSNLYQTYKRFLSKIKLQGLSPTKLFKVISQIQFMVVFVEKSEVSNRELYQSLNESKTDLSQINLITSFVTQCGEESSVAWRRTLHSFEKLELVPVLKQFIKDFLTVQSNGKVPEEKLLYKSFKTYFTKMSKYQSAEQIIENLRKYSQFYLSRCLDSQNSWSCQGSNLHFLMQQSCLSLTKYR